MPAYDETQLNLRFMTTFASQASKLAGKVQRYTKSHPLFVDYVASFSDTYAALENLALNLKSEFKIEINIPKVDKNCVYEKVYAFFELAPKVAQNLFEKYPYVYPWYEFGHSQQLYAAKVNMAESFDKDKNKYWMNAALKLAKTELLLRQNSLKYSLFDSIDDALLPEKFTQIAQDNGHKKWYDDDAAQILYEIANGVLEKHNRIDKKELLEITWAKLAGKYIVDESLYKDKSFLKNVDDLYDLIKSAQKKDAFFVFYSKYLDRQQMSFSDALSDEQILKQIFPLTQKSENSETKINAVRYIYPDIQKYENDGDNFEKMFSQQAKCLVNGIARCLSDKSNEIYSPLIFENFGFNTEENSFDKTKLFEFVDALSNVERFFHKDLKQKATPFQCDDKTISILKNKEFFNAFDIGILLSQFDSFAKNYNVFRKNIRLDNGLAWGQIHQDILQAKSCFPKLKLVRLMDWFYNEKLEEQNLKRIEGKKKLLSDISDLHRNKFDYLVDYLDTAKKIFPELKTINAEAKANDIDRAVSQKVVLPFYINQSFVLQENSSQSFWDKLFYDYAKSVLPQHKVIKDILYGKELSSSQNMEKIYILGMNLSNYQESLQKKSDLIAVQNQVKNALEIEQKSYSNYMKNKKIFESLSSGVNKENMIFSVLKTRKK